MRKLDINREKLHANLISLLASIGTEKKGNDYVRLDLMGDSPLVSLSERPECGFDYYLGAAFVSLYSPALLGEDAKEITEMDVSARVHWLFNHFVDIMSEIEKGELEDGCLNFVDKGKLAIYPALAWCES